MYRSTTVPCIYVVDDESALAHLTNSILGLNGYNASVFCKPELALEHLRNNPTESVLLITDCIMGSMNGLELIEEFKKSVSDLRTILLSGTITSEFLGKCQIQPDRFLAKPYAADALLENVQELVGERKVGI